MKFPATCAYLNACRVVNDISYNHSLSAIDLDILRAVDSAAREDGTLDMLRNELVSRLEKIKFVDEITAFSQVFERYGEILAYLHLSRGVTIHRLPERQNKKTPDFKCKLQDGRIFYVEVKSFDVVDGNLRNQEMMYDALDTNVDLETQTNAGKSVASSAREIEPYRKYGETDTYDLRSLITVINTCSDLRTSDVVLENIAVFGSDYLRTKRPLGSHYLRMSAH